ncbi:Small RNA 2'-O-methyltransferase [Thoreauomyces humboldtii]|nr:Small RNA 2'-O-methyltransferase [Thoreauomyces humboldtii]
MVVSTPNAEFNVHFPGLKYGTADSTFRHWDHRFEWTRAEFQHWANTAAQKYGYSVQFSGVGILESGLDDAGHCTQFATFVRLDSSHVLPPTLKSRSIAPYVHFASISFPYYMEEGHTIADVLQELVNRATNLVRDEWHRRCAAAAQASTGTMAEAPWPRPGEVTIPFESLWDFLRIRQLCKKRDRLTEVLRDPLVSPAFQLLSNENGEPIVRILLDVQKEEDFQSPTLWSSPRANPWGDRVEDEVDYEVSDLEEEEGGHHFSRWDHTSPVGSPTGGRLDDFNGPNPSGVGSSAQVVATGWGSLDVGGGWGRSPSPTLTRPWGEPFVGSPQSP